jgi:hypothetical protein
MRILHSYWRWIVLATWLISYYRALVGWRKQRDWTRGDDRAAVAFVSAVDAQLLIGLILYFGFSPYWTAAHASFASAMHDRVTRFFAVEHEVAMLLATVAAHVGRVLVKRRAASAAKHRVMLVALILFFVLVAWATPWPWRDLIGRPLFRLSP